MQMTPHPGSTRCEHVTPDAGTDLGEGAHADYLISRLLGVRTADGRDFETGHGTRTGGSATRHGSSATRPPKAMLGWAPGLGPGREGSLIA